ncbi:receptor-type tyrosine-protein phosphatase C [Salvelinus namaycush]|uniref:Receptor-type tyrosine-protein phosphatase C n=1 Tax=Salvelinus namaycush TaxID=8040 RepID=A0A8U1BNU5_SALNM|nr:receptor-type tyrosine-protein phosphatase C [Salvelinus namaycush]
MAGLYGLKILLLCTGLIELAICVGDTTLTGSTAAKFPPTTVAITSTPPSIPITPLNSQTASTSATSPTIADQDKSNISIPLTTQSTKKANDSTGPLLPNTTTITTTTPTTRSPTLSSLTPTSNIITQASSQATLSNAPGDSSTGTSDPASTLNQTQAFPTNISTSQPQTLPTNTSTSQPQTLPTNTSTSQPQTFPTNNSISPSPSLPTSTPPIHNQTSPASTPTSTTAIPTGSQTKPTPPKCTYTVKPVKYGFRIDLKASTSNTYNISYQDETRQTRQTNGWRQLGNSTVEVKSLKPCNIYTVMKIQPECELEGNRTLTTWKLEKDDIVEDIDCIPGSICYLSDWDISEATPNGLEKSQMRSHTCGDKSNALCFELRPADFCSEVNTTFPPETCANFTKTKLIPVESFLNANKIVLVQPERLPAKIKWENEPVNCNETLAINYTCQEQSNKNNLNLSQLEPFTNYTCTGRINHGNRTIVNTTSFRIECDVVINVTKRESTNSSISLEWEPSIDKCQRSDLLHLTYNCCCQHNKHVCNITKTQKCVVEGLDAYTKYTCSIQPVKYKNNTINISKKKLSKTIETATGVPDMVDIQTLTLTQNNAFTIKCTQSEPKKWRGTGKVYIATITGSGLHKTRNNTMCSFTFEDLSYLTTYTVQIFTDNGKHRSKPTETQTTTQYNDKAVIGFLVFLIVLTSLALLFVLYKIYILQRKKSNDNDEQIELIQPSDEENLLNVEPIGSEVLLDAYKRKIADEGRLFLQEFQSIPRIFSRNSVREAKKSCNQPKNRYVDILPYDYNRVQLTTGNGETGCDYINASFIDGFKESKKYIAAQGPKEETVGDFWRMVWEQQSSIIVMVTRCEESNRNKCAQYWPSPEREVEIFEEFVVKLNREEHCPDYIIRHLSLTNKREKSAEREVTHIQFTSWPDHGVPGEPHLLLKLRRRVNAFKNLFSGPIVIHCSAGVGRTGTYMGIDAMMEGLEAEGRVDIYGYVVKLRRQRCLMVQVEAQYILIHQALIEHNQFGETEISLAELHPTLGTLKQRDPGNEPTLLEAEFQRLPRYKNWRTFNTGINEENKKKNRSSSVIPYDYNRVLVKLEDESSNDQDDDDDDDASSDEEDEESTKYINATQIDGYWCQRSLIAAQGPLADTTGDFWQMVFQKKVETIVMLSDLTEGDQEFCSAYWGDEKKTFREIEVELKATETLPAYTTRSIQIRHPKRKDSRQVKQYQFLKWAGRELPEKPQDLTDMIKNIKQTCGYGNSKAERILPVVVHCNDGSSRSGIFCALWNIMDSAETEKLVDVFQVAKALRKERQGMIHSLEQYQFLYDAVEGSFPIQNGEVKQPATAPAAAADSIQVVNETKAEQPASATTATQQGAEVVKEAIESTPLVAGKEAGAAAEGNEDEAKEPGSPTEKTPLEGASNGPAVTLEV